MNFKIYSPDGTTSREAEFTIPAFEGDKGVQAVKEVVVAHQANARLGTHSTKKRGEVRGGGKKPWRQKGTGRARAGTTRAPHWTGGGVAFTPTARDFGFKVNRKERRAAFAGALSEHARNGSIAVIDGAALSEPSTKKALELLAGWQHELPLLIVVQPDEETLVKSFRNLPRTLVVPASKLEVVALIWARSLLVSEAALPLVQTKAEAAPSEGESK